MGDFDHRHIFNGSAIYHRPCGKGRPFATSMPKWLDTMVGGWNVGSLFIMQDGRLFTVFAQRTSRGLATATAGTWANYTGDRSGSVTYNPDGTVSFFTAAHVANISAPSAHQLSTGWLNR